MTQDFTLLLPITYALIELMGVIAALEAILKSRTTQGAMAWFLSLVFMPVIVLPLYLVLGRRKFQGYRKARRMGNKGIHIIPPDARQGLIPFKTTEQLLSQDDKVLEGITAMPFSRGNKLELLINGDEFFPMLFEKIDQAKEYIALSYYIVRADSTGQQLKDRLIKKAAMGVHVYFLYDEIGSLKLEQSFIQTLNQVEGIDFVPFHSTKGRANQFQLNFRNHRKITIIDGHCALLGGLNIGDEYRGMDQALSPWRDTGICIEGPAAASIQLAFLEDWHWATENIPTLNWQPSNNIHSDINSLVLPTGPADSLDSCTLIYLHLINTAKQQLWIVSPYFVPDPTVISALTLAALRGVDVRILLPKNPDHLLVQWSSQAYLKELLTVGVKFYYYREGFLHQKVSLIDDLYTTIGSPNLDNRSFHLNFEINLLSKDAGFAKKVKTMLEADMACSQQLHLDDVNKWSLPHRLLTRLSNLLAPIL